MISKSYKFNSINIDTSDGVLENIFNIPGYPILNLSTYNIEKIPMGSFCNNDNIEKVILPQTLKDAESSFKFCRNLNSITIPESVEKLDSYFLLYSDIYYDTSNWRNNVFYKDGWAITYNEGITSINIEEGTKKIANGFAYYSSWDNTPSTITSIVLPSTLEVVNTLAFYGQDSIKKIVIPKNVRKMEKYAFSCRGLERIEFYSTNLKDDEISCNEPFIFAGEYSTLETSTLFIGKDVTILPYRLFDGVCLYNIEFESGSKLEIFGKYCLAESNFKSITFPATTKEIRAGALYGNKNLQTINFKGTKSQWNSIIKGVNWKYRVPATYVQCTDGQVQI